MWPALRAGTAELSWLLSHGYAIASSLKLVGDRHNLTERQRTAIMRSACSDEARSSRLSRKIDPASIGSRPICIDGYNVLTTIETALAGGVVLIGRDTCWRDMASIHGTYRKVDETRPALEMSGQVLAKFHASPCVWYLDKPVSNSARLAEIIRQTATGRGWEWQVQIVPDPDPILRLSEQIVATADSVILDRCRAWINLAREIVASASPAANIVDLGASCATVAVE